MSQVVKATYIGNLTDFRAKKIPGSFFCEDPDEFGELMFWYFCPCGCGSMRLLNVGVNFKPPSGPSWEWNGSKEEPTLHPSVNHVNHWHGWLKHGKWLR